MGVCDYACYIYNPRGEQCLPVWELDLPRPAEARVRPSWLAPDDSEDEDVDGAEPAPLPPFELTELEDADTGNAGAGSRSALVELFAWPARDAPAGPADALERLSSSEGYARVPLKFSWDRVDFKPRLNYDLAGDGGVVVWRVADAGREERVKEPHARAWLDAGYHVWARAADAGGCDRYIFAAELDPRVQDDELVYVALRFGLPVIEKSTRGALFAAIRECARAGQAFTREPRPAPTPGPDSALTDSALADPLWGELGELGELSL